MDNLSLEWLRKIARKPTLPDDTTPFEASGGKFDDAYNIGYNDGRASLARAILERISEEW